MVSKSVPCFRHVVPLVILMRLVSSLGVLATASNDFGQSTPMGDQSESSSKTDKPLDKLCTLEKKPVNLSTELSSASDRFLVHYLFTAPLPNGKQIGWQGVVIRDKDRSAITVRTLDGLFYLYCTNGFCISIDPNNPGVFILQEKGFAPHVVYKNDPIKKKLIVHYGVTNANPSIDFDFSGMLQAMVPELVTARWEGAKNQISLATQHVGTDIFLVSDRVVSNTPSSIAKWVNWGGKFASAVVISPLSSSKIDYFSVDEALLIKRGARFRNLDVGETFISAPLPDFGKTQADQQAAAFLRSLFSTKSIPSTSLASQDGSTPDFGKDDLLDAKEFLHNP